MSMNNGAALLATVHGFGADDYNLQPPDDYFMGPLPLDFNANLQPQPSGYDPATDAGQAAFEADFQAAYGVPLSDVDVSGTGPSKGYDWAGNVLAPLVAAGAQIGAAYAKQELLGQSTYLLDKNGNPIKNAAGQPILANSSEGIKIATAAKKAGLSTAAWVTPVAIGVGVLALGLLMMKRGR